MAGSGGAWNPAPGLQQGNNGPTGGGSGNGFMQGVGNWFGNITGSNQSNTGAAMNQAGMANQAQAGGQLGGIGGKSASQFAQESGQAGQALGEQMGQTAATQGTRAATQAARTQGVNKGQAALLGSQQAGNAFTQGQTQGQQLGMGAYGQGANAQLGGASGLANLGSNQSNTGLGYTQAGTQAAGGLLGAVGGLLSSDKNVKEGIKESPGMKSVVDKVKPVDFKYKPEVGEGTEKQVGVLAQDMEKTPLKANVVDTPEGKMIDSRKQENSILNLIVELDREIRTLRKQLED